VIDGPLQRNFGDFMVPENSKFGWEVMCDPFWQKQLEEREMGATVLKFEPRESLTDFVKNKGKVSLIRRTGGRKSSENMAIFGENLTALAALKAGFGTAQENFKVNLIVIDPPYNVGGNQGYRNVWKGQSEKERDWAGDHGVNMRKNIAFGRTTGIALEALGKAMQNPGECIYVKDHYEGEYSVKNNKLFLDRIRDLVESLDLKDIEITARLHQVQIVSYFSGRKP
jgi:hypothetical protein